MKITHWLALYIVSEATFLAGTVMEAPHHPFGAWFISALVFSAVWFVIAIIGALSGWIRR